MPRKATSKVVKAAMLLDDVSTYHHIGMSPDQFVEFAKKASIYNGMERDSFVNLATFIDSAAPRMNFGGDNVNNGHHFAKLRVGNEGSRVVYLDLPKFYLAGNKDSLPHFLAELRKVAAVANVDEYNVINPSGDDMMNDVIVRMWWD